MKSIMTLAVLFGTLFVCRVTAHKPINYMLCKVHITYCQPERTLSNESAFTRVSGDIAALIDRDLPLATVDSKTF